MLDNKKLLKCIDDNEINNFKTVSKLIISKKSAAKVIK